MGRYTDQYDEFGEPRSLFAEPKPARIRIDTGRYRETLTERLAREIAEAEDQIEREDSARWAALAAQEDAP